LFHLQQQIKDFETEEYVTQERGKLNNVSIGDTTIYGSEIDLITEPCTIQ